MKGQESSSESEHLGVAKLRGIGDAIIGIGSLQYLKTVLPESELIYIVPNWVSPIFENVNGPWDHLLALNLNSFSGWMEGFQLLKQRKVNSVIELNQTSRGKKFFTLHTFLKGQYWAHDHSLNFKGRAKVLDQGVVKENLQRDLDGVYSFLAEKKINTENLIPSFLNYKPQLKLKMSVKPTNQLLLGIVAQRVTKMWPGLNVMKFVQEFLIAYPHWKVVAPISNQPQDLKIRDEIKTLDREGKIEFLQLPLNELPAIVAQSKIYVGNDTGLKHLAVALGLPTITLFGPENPREWHPYDQKYHKVFFIEGLPCRTKSAHFCGLAECDSMICLKDISPKKVLKEVEELLQSNS